MTTDALRIRKGTLSRKLKEQTNAKESGLHQRWLHTRDRPGAGIRTRLVCDKAAGGELHLLSEAEHAEFLEGWYRHDVKIIYDQVALERDKTQRAAASINVAHPFYRQLGEPAVISTALVYLTEHGTTHKREARSVRSSSTNKPRKRTRSQLIEQKTWEDDGASYSAVRANGMHARRSKNLAWIFRAHNDTVGRSLSDFEKAAQRELLHLVRWRKELRVIEACGLVDRTRGLPAGSGVQAFRQLAGAKRIAFDFDVSDPLDLKLGEVWRPKL
ncbi:TnsA endonuclease C-terminal domain-containing protein [Paraburkholderia sp. BL10I2N1]|uniref:TnsA endonuclease C-terminal domain-containing protein n=1 Tax=Paraburkholderia sp. BL10I2N1 TaxID=1938796 RepID=UPI00105CF202|nr:TnsA endonuclease C-terminal domain-containing protein [Paraburkholderia sp. BL10I2N1]TDN64016.1 TnsA endonuclease-like protein [Paraburkholderia sp. BL10I2N1]